MRKNFAGYILQRWKLLAAIVILSILSIPLNLINPYITKLVIDKAYGNKDLKLFFILIVIGAVVFITSGLVNTLSQYLSQALNRRLNFDITRSIFAHLQDQSISFFRERSTGEHIYKITNDISSVSAFFSDAVGQIVKLLPQALLILAITFYLNWKLALVVLVLVPASFIQPYLFGKWLKELTIRTIEKSQAVFKRLHESLSHMLLTKAFGKETSELRKFEKDLSGKLDVELEAAKSANVSIFFGSIVNKALGGVIVLYGGYQVIKGTLTLGSFLAIMLYLTQLLEIAKSFGRFYQSLTINSVSRRRLIEILETKPQITDRKDAVIRTFLNGNIEFRDVNFGYEKGRSVLSGVNFSISPAAKIALVGLSGCGKTTILSLILRLYEQEKGAVLIDGIDIKNIKLYSLKSQIGMVLQEPFLWNDTVKNNILYGDERATNDDMIRASKLSEAHDFIINLKDGYDSMIGEMACKLSEGQKQRIAIARALIKQPKILILDEAMSAVDSETEEKIVNGILNELKGSTIILVSHRLSAIYKMNMVYFIENGSSVKIDSHARHLEVNPKYRELFSGQI